MLLLAQAMDEKSGPCCILVGFSKIIALLSIVKDMFFN